MTADAWLDANNRYLAAALQWLRLKLQAMAAGGDAAVTAGAAAVAPAAPAASAPAAAQTVAQTVALPPRAVVARRSWFGRETAIPATEVVPAHSPPAATPGADALARADEERRKAAAADPPPALATLAQRFGLSAFESDLLLLCAAVELDPALPALVAAVQGQSGRASPSFALALQLFDEPSWDALSPLRPLRAARLLEISQPGATPLVAAALRADERIVHYLKGLNMLDERLHPLLTAEPQAGEPRLAPSQQEAAERALQALLAASRAGRPATVALLGSEADGKFDLARSVCERLGRQLRRMPMRALPTARADTDQLARLWQRESLLLPLALYVDADELDEAGAELSGALRHFVSQDLGVLFVALREPPAQGLAGAAPVEAARPSAAEQHGAWSEGLAALLPADAAHDAADRLAGQFNFSLREIGRVVDECKDAAAEARPASLWTACRRLAQPRLDQLAERIHARARWDDIVLPADAQGLLRRIAEQVRHRYRVYEDWGWTKRVTRGLGISALFAGESGTGKTMAAEVIANELELALYRIDLSAVVSKYIGETEKNLRRLFDAAERGGAILFFDEADALFGKRSEVKDSHDRYANIEINYLLQRMESFGGLAILATNMKSALDPAFMRRLRFVLNFPFPGPAERKRMWQQALPHDVPRDEAIDFDRLARFSFSGGNIHSVALNAAFAAAAQGGAVTQSHLLTATRNELRKLERQVNEGEFR